MNGYSNNGFTQSLNGILSITDGLGTLISEGKISTGDITGEDIVADTLTVTTLKVTDEDLINLNSVDIMTENIVGDKCGFGNFNSSNRVTCVDLICSSITCKNIRLNNITNHYTDKIGGYLNIAISPYLKIPLITSIYDTTSYITNYDLSTILINTNLNSLILLPYYMATFYNDNRIIFICDNSTSTSLLYNLIVFDPSDLICTKILISYKNIII